MGAPHVLGISGPPASLFPSFSQPSLQPELHLRPFLLRPFLPCPHTAERKEMVRRVWVCLQWRPWTAQAATLPRLGGQLALRAQHRRSPSRGSGPPQACCCPAPGEGWGQCGKCLQAPVCFWAVGRWFGSCFYIMCRLNCLLFSPPGGPWLSLTGSSIIAKCFIMLNLQHHKYL